MTRHLLTLGLALFLAGSISAEVLLDVVAIETKHAFLLPDHADEHGYHYVPKAPRIALWEDGRPKFTFLQYNRTGRDVSGGLLHFIATYGLTAEELDGTRSELEEIDEEGVLLGPVPFVEGEFHIISASLDDEGPFGRRVVGSGKAPLLAGQEAAVSAALTEEGSTLLMESFKKQTSDVSLQFVMTYQGLTPPFEARLHVDWDKVYEHKDVNVKVGFVLGKASITKVFDDLREEGAIRVEVLGDDANMEALLQTAYNTLTTMMFEARPIKAEDLGKSKTKSAKGSWLNKLIGGSNIGYHRRETRFSGEYTVDLSRRSRGRRQLPITGNIGDIHDRWGADGDVFGFIDLDDPAFQERPIQVVLDIADLDTFGEYVNFAGVNYERKHDTGAITEGTVTFYPDKVRSEGTRGSFTYLRKQDRPRQWKSYRYRTLWSFRGGVEEVGDWQETDQDVITLSAPYSYRTIEVTAEQQNLAEHGIWAVVVRFQHEYLGRTVTREVTLRRGEPLNAFYRYVNDKNNLEYRYQIAYFKSPGKIETEWQEGSDPFVHAFLKPETE